MTDGLARQLARRVPARSWAFAAGFLCASLAMPVHASAQVRILDSFDNVRAWAAHPSDGVSLAIRTDAGKVGRAMRMDVDFHGGAGYAIDPVCGMQVRTADAPATAVHAGERHFFCSDGCREHFEAKSAAGVDG